MLLRIVVESDASFCLRASRRQCLSASVSSRAVLGADSGKEEFDQVKQEVSVYGVSLSASRTPIGAGQSPCVLPLSTFALEFPER
eukprot:4018522-Lingulodinium_polyedra.AAC.1